MKMMEFVYLIEYGKKNIKSLCLTSGKIIQTKLIKIILDFIQ